jgi:glycosyltransferase involved in cell wall biosynthesis
MDALLLPRRYGGLSLVMQEAWATGMPVVGLDRVPENAWAGVVPADAADGDVVPMKGGNFTLSDADPAEYARAWTELADADFYRVVSRDADWHADQLDWTVRYPQWADVLDLEPKETRCPE